MLSVRNLVKIYKSKNHDNEVVALNNVSIDFPDTGLVFLLGKSGSGKSTLLNSIGGLDSFDGGEIIIKGKSSYDFTQSDFDSYRNTFIGFIFQEYNILENFTVEKNLALAIELQGKKPSKAEIERLLRQVDMLEYAKRKPNELSGGQKQRVAIARALIKDPEIIMADEPTGALDSNTGKQVMDTLKELSKSKLVIIVSHDREFAEIYGDRIVELKDGVIISDVSLKEVKSKKTESGVSFVDGRFIHIKKGQRITQDDFRSIARKILDNSKTHDTIISLDDESNKVVKKAENITDTGDQKVFLKTEKDDIRTKTYYGEDLKFIKSKLKFKDSFKMGASSLKSKVGKLVFTIILAVFAFTTFGVVDTFSAWDRPTTTYEALLASNITTVAATQAFDWYGYSSYMYTQSKNLASLQNKYSDYVIKGVVNSSYYAYYLTPSLNYSGSSSLSLTDSDGLDGTGYSGCLYLSSSEISKLGFTLYGNLPSSETEVCVSKYLFENWQKANSSITTYEDLQIRVYADLEGNGSSYTTATIVGLIDDGEDWSRFENLSESELKEKQETISECQYFSYSRLIYINETAYENAYNSNSSQWIAYIYDLGDDSYVSYSAASADYVTSSPADDSSNITYFKGGVSKVRALKDNEIILPYSFFSTSSIDESYESLIDKGMTVTLTYEYEYEFVELTVVGVSNNYFYVNDDLYETIQEAFKGYGFILTKLTGTSTDKQLISAMETYSTSGYITSSRFLVQNENTSTINTFENILTILSIVLLVVSIAFAVFAGLLLINFISTSISYKKREIGVLRALGARGKDVFGIFFNESMLIALINFVFSVLFTFAICLVINLLIINQLGVAVYLLSFGIRQIVLLLGISVLVAFLASVIPVTKIARKKPIDAINNR